MSFMESAGAMEAVGEMEHTPDLPAEELRDWIRRSYGAKRGERAIEKGDEPLEAIDAYSEQLRDSHLRAIEERNVELLERLSLVLAIRKTDLYASDRAEYDRQTDLYDRLVEWIRYENKDLQSRAKAN